MLTSFAFFESIQTSVHFNPVCVSTMFSERPQSTFIISFIFIFIVVVVVVLNNISQKSTAPIIEREGSSLTSEPYLPCLRSYN